MFAAISQTYEFVYANMNIKKSFSEWQDSINKHNEQMYIVEDLINRVANDILDERLTEIKSSSETIKEWFEGKSTKLAEGENLKNIIDGSLSDNSLEGFRISIERRVNKKTADLIVRGLASEISTRVKENESIIEMQLRRRIAINNTNKLLDLLKKETKDLKV